MRLKAKQFIGAAAAVLLCAAAASGCSKGIALVSEVAKTEAYSLPQSMIVVATERNRYQNIYTSQIWGEELPDSRTFESYLLEQVQHFLQDVKTMNLLAQEKGIVLTGSEKEELRELSEEYYASLSKDDIAYTGAAKEDVQVMYEAYYTAEKVVSELTRDMNLEISDSEAKVITVERIVLSDETTAGEVLAKVLTEGADFAAIAKEFSEEAEGKIQMGRGENPGKLEDQAFSLSSGGFSSVISQDGKYYILKCISDYDESATQARKDSLYKERKKEAFGQVYNQFKADHPMTFDNGIWDKISFSKDDKTTTANFFELYEKHFHLYG